MKRLIALTPILAALAACATPAAPPADAAFDPSATEFTGWVRVNRGEFQLFQVQRDLDNTPSPARCVSGALPRNMQETARELSGSKVTFTGRAAPWSDRGTSPTLQHEGSLILNLCGGDHVIEAQSVRVLR